MKMKEIVSNNDVVMKWNANNDCVLKKLIMKTNIIENESNKIICEKASNENQ